MTDSEHGRKPGKRERLVAGAREVIHQLGVEKTTIADIAQAAEVPAGNVYYYYKTKDELVAAAIDSHPTDEQLIELVFSESEGSTTVLMVNSRISTDERRRSQDTGWRACLDELGRLLGN